MLCQFLVYRKVNQLYVCVLFFFNFILFIFLYSRFLLVIYFIHISVCMSIPIGCVLISFFYMQLSSFTAPLIEQAVLSPFYVLASFIKDKMTICAWVYLQVLYPLPLIYISVFVPVPESLDYCTFVVQSEVRETVSSSSIFLSQDCFGYSGSFVFPYKL